MSPGPLLSVAALGQLLALAAARVRPGLALSGTLVSSTTALGAAAMVLIGGNDWVWRSPLELGGSTLHLGLDGLSAFFLVLLAVISGAGAVFAHTYWSDAAHPRSAVSGRRWWAWIVASLGFVLLSMHGLHFLIGWESFTVSGYFLITLDRSRRDTRAAGWLYLAASHAGTLALFAFFTALAGRTGSWSLGPLLDRPDVAPLFWLALLGFGLKAGIFPLHVWLPSAHASAPSHVSALLSGFAIKMGVYGLLRFSGWMPVPAVAGWTLAALGATSAVLGVAFALGQHDLKRLLAYHSVENVGIIVLGLGFALLAFAHDSAAWGQLAFAGALLHTWNHGLFKSLLFLGAGSVLHATGTREMSRLGGLWRHLPATTLLFGVGAAAICGLPPLNGFVSELLVYLGLFEAAVAQGPVAWAAVAGAVVLAITGGLALACFVKVCGVVFLGAPRSSAVIGAHDPGRFMLTPSVGLAAACVAIGLAPAAVWPLVARAAQSWRSDAAAAMLPAPLVTVGWIHVALVVLGAVAVVTLTRAVRRRGASRAPTWDCGYATPTARMQYTAGSFAAILTGGFSWILRPSRHTELSGEPFPPHGAHHQHTPETVLDCVVVPASAGVLRLAGLARRLQQGRLQTYLLYLVIGLFAVAALAAMAYRQ